MSRPLNLRLTVKAARRLSHKITSLGRVLWYNITNFSYYSALPWSTTVYGRILTLEAPTHLRMGRGGRIGASTYFATSRNAAIVAGDMVNINLGCVLVAMDRIEIGSGTSIAEYVTIRDQEHKFIPGQGTRDQGFHVAAVRIGQNVWVGRGVYIGPGTVLGDGCVVGANSVVKGKFPPNVLIAGAPATIKREIA